MSEPKTQYLESHHQAKILRWIEKQPNTYVFKVLKANKAGVLDIVGCYYGLFFTIEVKRIGETPDPLQVYNIKQVHKANGYAFVCFYLEDAQRAFEVMEYEIKEKRDLLRNIFPTYNGVSK